MADGSVQSPRADHLAQLSVMLFQLLAAALLAFELFRLDRRLSALVLFGLLAGAAVLHFLVVTLERLFIDGAAAAPLRRDSIFPSPTVLSTLFVGMAWGSLPLLLALRSSWTTNLGLYFPLTVAGIALLIARSRVQLSAFALPAALLPAAWSVARADYGIAMAWTLLALAGLVAAWTSRQNEARANHDAKLRSSNTELYRQLAESRDEMLLYRHNAEAGRRVLKAERHRLHEECTAAKQRLEQILEKVSAMWFELDGTGTIQQASESTHVLLGYPAENLSGKPFSELLERKETADALLPNETEQRLTLRHANGRPVPMALSSYRCQADDSGAQRVRLIARSPVDSVIPRAHLAWEGRLHQALEQDRFTLHFQPIVELAQGGTQAHHGEILLRLRDEDAQGTERLLAPDAFFPAAESFRLMPQIDRWVIRRTLEALNLDGPLGKHLATCSINLSPQSLEDQTLAEDIVELIRNSGIAPELLCFEIPERAALGTPEAVHTFAARLRGLGCRIALDDFTATPTAFSCLKQLPVDFVKLNAALLQDISGNEVNRTLLEAVTRITRKLGMHAIAGFVEDEQTLETLRSSAVDYAQGYWVGRPDALPAYSGSSLTH